MEPDDLHSPLEDMSTLSPDHPDAIEAVGAERLSQFKEHDAPGVLVDCFMAASVLYISLCDWIPLFVARGSHGTHLAGLL